MIDINKFQETKPNNENYWRSIVLFGRNVASYKFALAKSLLELMPHGKSILTLEDLAEPFSRNICEHIEKEPKQITSNSSRFLETCKGYNDGTIDKNELLETTIRLGFNNVIDAFHIVNNEELPQRFYQKDYSAASRKIILTDSFYQLGETLHHEDLILEAEARWRLVESAWRLGLSRNLIHVHYDHEYQELYTMDVDRRRTDVTSAKDALNGYQKGKCFYCFDDITLDRGHPHSCDVDHFFPHILGTYQKQTNYDGIWNLVLACSKCNRGNEGKFSKIPKLKYLERLHRRNEFLISSHHPLRDTLMRQSGAREEDRRRFLQYHFDEGTSHLIFQWETPLVGEESF